MYALGRNWLANEQTSPPHLCSRQDGLVKQTALLPCQLWLQGAMLCVAAYSKAHAMPVSRGKSSRHAARDGRKSSLTGIWTECTSIIEFKVLGSRMAASPSADAVSICRACASSTISVIGSLWQDLKILHRVTTPLQVSARQGHWGRIRQLSPGRQYFRLNFTHWSARRLWSSLPQVVRRCWLSGNKAAEQSKWASFTSCEASAFFGMELFHDSCHDSGVDTACL